jgi:hypothetical protein
MFTIIVFVSMCKRRFIIISFKTLNYDVTVYRAKMRAALSPRKILVLI